MLARELEPLSCMSTAFSLSAHAATRIFRFRCTSCSSGGFIGRASGTAVNVKSSGMRTDWQHMRTCQQGKVDVARARKEA